MSELTERQEAVYQFILDTICQHGYTPTIRDIGRHFGIRSVNGVVCHLNGLEKRGWIKRGSRIKPLKHKFVAVPVEGNHANGS